MHCIGQTKMCSRQGRLNNKTVQRRTNIHTKQYSHKAIFTQSHYTLGNVDANSRQTSLIRLTHAMLSTTGVSSGTNLGTCKAANGVLAAVAMTTPSVVYCTFVDIYVITTKEGFDILKIV